MLKTYGKKKTPYFLTPKKDFNPARLHDWDSSFDMLLSSDDEVTLSDPLESTFDKLKRKLFEKKFSPPPSEENDNISISSSDESVLIKSDEDVEWEEFEFAPKGKKRILKKKIQSQSTISSKYDDSKQASKKRNIVKNNGEISKVRIVDKTKPKKKKEQDSVKPSDMKLKNLSVKLIRINDREKLDSQTREEKAEAVSPVVQKEQSLIPCVVITPLKVNINNEKKELALENASGMSPASENLKKKSVVTKDFYISLNKVDRKTRNPLRGFNNQSLVSSTPTFKKPFIQIQRLTEISPIKSSDDQNNLLISKISQFKDCMDESGDMFASTKKDDDEERGEFVKGKPFDESQKKNHTSALLSSVVLTPDSSSGISPKKVAQTLNTSEEKDKTDSISVVNLTPDESQNTLEDEEEKKDQGDTDSVSTVYPIENESFESENFSKEETEEGNLISNVNSTQSKSFESFKRSSRNKINISSVRKDISSLYEPSSSLSSSSSPLGKETEVNSSSNVCNSSTFSQDTTDKKNDNDKVDFSEEWDDNQSSIVKQNCSSSKSLYSPSILTLSSKSNLQSTFYLSPDISYIKENIVDKKNNVIKLENSYLYSLKNNNIKKPYVLLERLNNSGFITKRRGSKKKFSNLMEIHEENEIKNEFGKENDNPSNNSFNDTKKKSVSFALSEENSVVESSINQFNERNDRKTLYLRPGKSWARSLSILNRIHNDQDIEEFSGGKGKKWRESVRGLLSMQPPQPSVGISCIKEYDENEDVDNEEEEDDEKNDSNSSCLDSSSTINQTTKSITSKRILPRFSMRVVLNNDHKTNFNDCEVQDSLFLKVYGLQNNSNCDNPTKKSVSPVEKVSCTHSEVQSIGNIPLKPVIAARDVILERCEQTDVISFQKCYNKTFLKHCRKIGEGVYGEVFFYQNGSKESVIKIIPIEGEDLVNGEPQKKFHEILSEIIISKELHNLRNNNDYNTNGFIEVKNIKCIKGKYPDKLIELWKEYDEEKQSENDSPTMFKDNQLYISLEFVYGGVDLESFSFKNAVESYSAFLQTALTLAVAEKSLEFEHRDLHWGNILISRTDKPENLTYKFKDKELTLVSKNVKVSIIDFTLSRLSYENCCIFNDLALDPALFTAVGEYQFEIYRLMRDKVNNNWQRFEPYTNILWLHYVLDKMINLVRYDKVKTTTKIHKNTIKKLQGLKDVILDYDSAYDFIMNCDDLENLLRKDLI